RRPGSAQNACTSALLPIPASPPTSTSRPVPRCARANASPRAARAASRSSRSAPVAPGLAVGVLAIGLMVLHAGRGGNGGPPSWAALQPESVWPPGRARAAPAPSVGAARPTRPREAPRPRYVIERTFPEGLRTPADAAGAELCLEVAARNAERG